MYCPNCGAEKIRILGEDYCPKCNKKLPEEKKEEKADDTAEAVEENNKNSIKAIFTGFISSILVVFALFLFFLLLNRDFGKTAKDVLLIFSGFSAAFFGGLVSAKIDPQNYLRNALILGLIAAFLNSVFNFFYDFNISRTLLSLVFSVLIYPLPFLAGAAFFKKWVDKSSKT